jgi:hypothetical protein
MGQVWTALAVDERYREKGKNQEVIYCGVNVNGVPNELQVVQEHIPTELQDSGAFGASLEGRTYSFCLVHTKDLNRIHPKKRIAVILAGLLFGEPVDRVNGLQIYVDGALTDPSKGMAKIAVHRATGIPKSAIHIYCGKHLDSHQLLTNLAHKSASYLLGKSDEEIYSHKRRKLLPVWQLNDMLHLGLSKEELSNYLTGRPPVRALQAILNL